MKTVLITGANTGIGLAVASVFLEHDYTVIAHYHTTQDNLNKIKNDRLFTYQADFSKIGEVRRMYRQIVVDHVSVDILINNAGTFSTFGAIVQIPEEEYDRIMDTNLKSAFILSQLSIKDMIDRGWGRILNVSSIGVRYGGSPGSAHYTLSKAGLELITKSFAKEGASSNVLVNTVRVGVTDTRFHDLNTGKDMLKRAKLIPLQRMAHPSEIADFIFFLSSEKNSYITGEILTIAGGE